MRKFNITGMSCAACSARVEKAVNDLNGIESCSVSLLTNTLVVTGSASEKSIIDAVKKAGYGISEENDKESEENFLNDTETPLLLKRFIISLTFLVFLMYLSMGHIMWGFPLPIFLAEKPLLIGIIQLIIALVVAVINRKFFINGFKGLIRKSPNMDTLVALGSAAAFIYSSIELFKVPINLHGLYFESSAMILTLITLGKMLESKSKGKTTNAIKGLIQLSPKTANLLIDGKEVTIEAEKVKVGDIFTVKAGESVPVDAVITEGICSLDQSALTGESIPADKGEGENVSAGSICKSGFIKCRATRVGENTTLAAIIKTVRDAAATKAPIARIADKVSGVFVPCVMVVALVTFVCWLIAGQSVGYSLSRGISVLVISCPCALGLATPVAVTVGSGVGAKHGILYKTAATLEAAGKTDIAVLDKTGTITEGKPMVTDIISDDNELLIRIAASVEAKSEHPLSVAIKEMAEENGAELFETTDYETHTGNGVSAVINGKLAVGGKLSFVEKYCTVPNSAKKQAEQLSLLGKTPLYFSYDQSFLGIIAVADSLKKDSKEAVAALKKMGIRVVMLTGDNKPTAEAVARQAGIEEVIAEVLPDGKEKVIRRLKKEGRVLMAGDGINDAPALSVADTGVAMASGTDIAADSADIVVLGNKLLDICAAINLSRLVLRNIKQNLFWAFCYNVLGIPLAAGAFVALLGWELNPMFGAAAMSLSSFCVVTNALRLNFSKIYYYKFRKSNYKKETEVMTKTIRIEGMMCPHCEARVKAVLEEMKGVNSAEVSHKDGTAVVTLGEGVNNEDLQKIIENSGYKVLSIDN